ncbi:MAG: hypothetical protein FJ100_18610 [Deltaproteobacteria bacterium]|nr:hypothetical protein [Deltaproteobacteria bacterium]
MALSKPLVAGLAGAVVLAAGGWVAYTLLPGMGAGMGYAGELDGAHTVAVAEARHLDAGLARLAAELKKLPPEVQAELRLDKAKAQLGFDPLDPAGWATSGIDLKAGVTVALDARMAAGMPTPVAALRIIDEAKLLAFASKLGADLQRAKTVGAAQSYTLAGGGGLWVGKRGDRTLIAPMLGPADTPPPGFDAVLLPSPQKLGDTPNFKQLANDGRGSLDWLAYADSAQGHKLVPGKAKLGDDMAHYAKLLPYAAMFSGDRGGVRVGTSPQAHTALQQLFVPAKRPPKCAKWFGKSGWSAARLSLNLPDMFTGAVQFMPPSVPAEVRNAPAMVPGLFAVAMGGISWGEFTAAFSGHVCAGFDGAAVAQWMASGKQDPSVPFIGVIGMVDRPKAEEFLNKMITFAKGRLPAAPTDIALDGAKGYKFKAGPLEPIAVLYEDALIVASSEAVFKAGRDRAKADSMAGGDHAEALDGDVVFGQVADLMPFVLAASDKDKARGKHNPSSEAAVQALAAEPVMAWQLELDQAGLIGTARTKGAAAAAGVVGVLAAVAVPALHKYTRQAKTSEALVHLQDLRRAASAYFTAPQVDKLGNALPCRFPTPAPVTPAGTSCCDPALDKDGDKRCDANPTLWDVPAWQALSFARGDRHYYQYAFDSSGEGNAATYTATAYGDLDCDGVFSTFQLTGKGQVDASGACEAAAPTEIVRDNEFE